LDKILLLQAQGGVCAAWRMLWGSTPHVIDHPVSVSDIGWYSVLDSTETEGGGYHYQKASQGNFDYIGALCVTWCDGQ
jgi:hypothetical protein